jgi:predicted RNA-binding protein YlxR (DUF448 family)
MGRQARATTGAKKCDASGDNPMRTCAVTRVAHTPDALIRFVRGPGNQIVPDLACNLPGRGVWITCSRPAVESAGRSGAFARSLRQSVVVPEDLAETVDRLLVQRAVGALGLANKAGLLVRGFVQVEALITGFECAALIHAADASDDGVRKLDQRLRAAGKAGAGLASPPVIRVLTSEELSLAIGRPNVIHAALRQGGAGAQFIAAARRLQRYRSVSEDAAETPVARVTTEQV